MVQKYFPIFACLEKGCYRAEMFLEPTTLPSKEQLMQIAALDDNYDATTFDWSTVKPLGLLNYCMPSPQAERVTCGKILSHCQERVIAFRQKLGIRLCVFKIGITSNPIIRYKAYVKTGFSEMHMMFCCSSRSLISMLEAALISEFHKHVGCRNKGGTGGDGALNRATPPPPPHYVYITGGRADQSCRVG